MWAIEARWSCQLVWMPVIGDVTDKNEQPHEKGAPNVTVAPERTVRCLPG